MSKRKQKNSNDDFLETMEKFKKQHEQFLKQLHAFPVLEEERELPRQFFPTGHSLSREE